jgi:uncharacterized MAPEG superfamily protein
MALAWWCLLAAGVMPVLLAGVAKAGGGYDNGRPRDFATSLEGYRKRAYAAHQNGFEAFPLFAAAVLAAAVNGVSQPRIDLLAIVFVAARLAYAAAYLGDWPTLRSAFWTVGFVACLALLTAPVWA